MNESKIILNRLLDKYEQSSHFSSPGISNRRVLLKIPDKNLPEYNYQNVDVRDAFKTAIEFLVKNEVISVEWLPGRKHLVAKELWLNLDNVDSAYALASRNPLKAKLEEYHKIIVTLSERITTPWLKNFLMVQQEKLRDLNHLTGLYRKEHSHIIDVLIAMEHYDQIDDNGISMRAFSIDCYHNSKYFEKNIIDDFLVIAREYCPTLSELMSDHDLGVKEQLACLGIYARPEIYEFAGPITLETSDGICDCAPLARYGFAVTSKSIEDIKEIVLNEVNKIIFIENKTNYDVFIEKFRSNDELIIYHGGFLSPQKKKFISQVISSASEHIQYFFWADIDVGGFKMFSQLKNLVPNLAPYKMSVEEIEKYAPFGLKRNVRYMCELEKLLNLKEFTIFSDEIKALLMRGITIEQEIMLGEL